MATVLCPGSFDPFHLGHLDVIEQAAALFGPVIVATMHNPAKPSGMFTLDERMQLIRASVAHLPEVKVESFSGLVVELGIEIVALGPTDQQAHDGFFP